MARRGGIWFSDRRRRGGRRGAGVPSCALAVVATVIVVAVPRAARAVDKMACVEAHERSQKLTKQGRVPDSREQLAICADPSCPTLVREDCKRWLSNLDSPSRAVTIEARDASGKVLMAVRGALEVPPAPTQGARSSNGASADEDEHDHPAASTAAQRPRAEPRAGAAPEAAPGSSIEAASESSQEPKPEVSPTPPASAQDAPAEAEPIAKAPPPAAVLPKVAQSPSPPVALAPPVLRERSAHGTSGRALPTAAWITGALALASFGTGAILGLTGASEARTLRETCAPACQESQVSTVRQELLIGDMALLTGVGLTAVTGWLIWHRPQTEVAEARNQERNEERKPEPAKLSAWVDGRSFRLGYAASF